MAQRHDPYDRPILDEELEFEGGVRPGEPLPDFDLVTTDRGRVQKSDYFATRPFVFHFGSITSPATASAIPILKQLHDQFRDQIEFLTIYDREEHPGDRYPEPETFEEKLRHARDLLARDRVPWPMAVDDVHGSFARAMDAKPTALYLVDENGTLVRELMATDPIGLAGALERFSIDPARASEEPGPSVAAAIAATAGEVGVMDEVLEAAGPAAVREAKRRNPALYWLGRLAGRFRPLSPVARVVAAGAAAGAGALAAVAVGFRLGARDTRASRRGKRRRR